MPSEKINREIEIKLRVPGAAALQRRLKRLRARKILPRTYESNTLYDTPSRTLTRRGQLIRIRIEQPTANASLDRPAGNRSAILTFKGPSNSSRGSQTRQDSRKQRMRFKIREEVEVRISDPDQMNSLLRALGLVPTFRYEKFRTTYALPGIRGLKVEFDETPVGLFLELEGSAAAIDHAASLLGYARSDYITQTYGALYLADCGRSGRKPSHMVFKQTKKLC